VNGVDDGHLRAAPVACLSAEKVAPLWLNGPADEPLGMRLAQGCNCGQRMENIPHRTESHDEYTQLLFCWRQFFIFSQ
jgi:hypothetical protein